MAFYIFFQDRIIHDSGMTPRVGIHYIFSFPKGEKEKDSITIPHAIPFSEQDF
jgi:hypothetical protein